MFYGATSFNQPIGNWNTSKVTFMSSMFQNATSFNQPIGNWNTSKVTGMNNTFYGASNFNQDIDTSGSSWDVSSVTSMANIFRDASGFNGIITNWNITKVTNMSSMFQNATIFNQPIGRWVISDVSTVNMSNMFYGATNFNQPIDTSGSSWNVSNVTSMANMFRYTNFNKPISNWNVTKVTNMTGMFYGATSFNQPIGTWVISDVSNVNMTNMFNGAISFNQPLNWNTSNVTDMSGMFQNATSFNQDISFNFTSCTSMLYFIENTGYNPLKMSKLLKLFNKNTTFISKNIGNIPPYLNTTDISNTVFELTTTKSNSFTGTPITPDLATFKTLSYDAADLKYIGFTATELKTAGYTAAELKTAGFTATELKIAGYTAAELKTAGFTATELKTAGFTLAELKTAGFTATELKTAGFTATELKTAGFTATELKTAGFTATELKTILMSYTISDLSNTTLVYDNTVTSTTIATNEDDSIYNINVSTRNFKYYNIVTSTYEKYNTICISTNGWLGFSSSITESNYGKNNNLPINTLRYFSFDAISTIKYYYDMSGNLMISTSGSHYSSASDTTFNIIIKIDPIGIIIVYYSSIGTGTRNPIIGWVGNNSSVSTDDLFYKTFDGVQPFVQSNINGKFLNFYLFNTIPLQLKTAGFTATELKTAGFTDADLINAGYITPTLSNFSIPNKTYGNAPFTITDPSSNSPGAFSYTSSNQLIADISGKIISITGSGSATITATQAATANYTSGTIDASFNVLENSPGNPVNISNSNELMYFLNTTATYCNLTNDIYVTNDLRSTSNKIFVNNTLNNINIRKQLNHL
jgi:surface protein